MVASSNTRTHPAISNQQEVAASPDSRKRLCRGPVRYIRLYLQEIQQNVVAGYEHLYKGIFDITVESIAGNSRYLF